MTVYGPNNAGGATGGSSGVGWTAWANPGNAAGWDPTGAFNTEDDYTKNTGGAILTLSNFGFAIPSLETILGIVVEIMKAAGSTSTVKDGNIFLFTAGGTQSSTRAGSTNWSTSFTDTLYGGATDLWGLSLTPAIVNDPGFNVQFTAHGNGSGAKAFVSGGRMTIYTNGGGGGGGGGSGIVFRKTLSRFGSGVGRRQAHYERQILVPEVQRLLLQRSFVQAV